MGKLEVCFKIVRNNELYFYKCCLIIICLSLNFSCQIEQNDTINLAGSWDFKIDSLDLGEQEQWYNNLFEDQVELPGSMSENGKGDTINLETNWTGNLWNDSLWYKSEKYKKYREKDNLKISFWLQPDKRYYGAAWYQKEIEIPQDWSSKIVQFSIERAHWYSSLWIDGKKIGDRNYLGTPHTYTLGVLTPGPHTLTVKMDNRVKDINVGLDAHSISDNTQGNWNGLVGDLKLEALPKTYIENVRLFPNVVEKSVRAEVIVQNTTKEQKNGSLGFQAKGFTTGVENIASISKEYQIKPGQNKFIIEYPMGEHPELWDEFHPNLYTMEVSLSEGKGIHKIFEKFGMRNFKAVDTRFEINGKPVFLRGTLECSIFPNTGYPPTDKTAWSRIFEIIKNHGLNHMRFHSWCPPESAFQAADEAGVYLQVEASAWTTIGDGAPIDQWLYKEAESILSTYGNHPSFVMMAYGNEPSGANHKEYLIDFVDHLKTLDATKMYTSAAGWPFIENADYFNTPKPRIQQWNENLNSIINAKTPQTTFDYHELIEKTSMPVVSHEIGQWCVYPNFKEISKYKGNLKPKNFEIFKESLALNGLAHLSDSLLLASGKLQTLCYKADIEAALRTKDFAGFQLLDLHDFPGQGTALVGVLDAFWDEKGYVSPEEFKSFSGATVPLIRLPKRIYKNNDTLKASVELAHFGAKPLKLVTPKWQLETLEGDVVKKGTLKLVDSIPLGNKYELGKIEIALDEIKQESQLKLRVEVAGNFNSWEIWVYPNNLKNYKEDIKVVNFLDSQTLEFLKEGGKVLLNTPKGSIASEYGGDIAVGFSSIFWNTSWTNGQKPHTLGILCDPEHPALAKFPTQFHSNWQWWDAMSHSNVIITSKLNPELKPIVRVIDDWFENRSLALVTEAKVGRGKLLISGIDLNTNLNSRVEAQQLLHSLKSYMVGSKFDPQVELEADQLLSIYNL